VRIDFVNAVKGHLYDNTMDLMVFVKLVQSQKKLERYVIDKILFYFVLFNNSQIVKNSVSIKKSILQFGQRMIF
jgi:hypothetical protein